MLNNPRYIIKSESAPDPKSFTIEKDHFLIYFSNGDSGGRRLLRPDIEDLNLDEVKLFLKNNYIIAIILA